MRRADLTLGLSLLLLLALQACGATDSDPGPGGVTAGDARALDEAARKLDERDQQASKEAGK